MKPPKFTASQFAYIAYILQNCQARQYHDPELVFASHLALTNENFNRGKFLKALGIKENGQIT
jgi:hypothetical protein